MNNQEILEALKKSVAMPPVLCMNERSVIFVDYADGHGEAKTQVNNWFRFLGDYNYLVMPEKIYATISLEVPHYVGVYVLDGTELTCIKKAKRHDRSRPVSEMLLMMFRSAARDRRRICSEITQE